MKKFEFKDSLEEEYEIKIKDKNVQFYNIKKDALVGLSIERLLTGWCPATGGKVSPEAIKYAIKLLKNKAFW